ncbi:hypothetical protein PF005_g8937 [Phytophthora fragariae]|uniref:Uncharacterized protein n=1 Tax=Phytophthora fragariae TaxID=53985 RepID=A0A6A3L9K8_9STRA|nr:hypothetical protein PF009_g9914 [Phytophthora fragariae]KAE9014778.1 hypothetical protein PF011_g7903 [Phytophthora fragariae]KAE9118151.1 hypothetical protein PF007_g9026 [Phytophthora fragariae]KAE9118217.1 hypothetical protein PF010_g8292 [Phytophthora fragariae]KAE9143427.1 hypothetical protein PF006_g11539 [Phytophthora fragariae]
MPEVRELPGIALFDSIKVQPYLISRFDVVRTNSLIVPISSILDRFAQTFVYLLARSLVVTLHMMPSLPRVTISASGAA